MSRAEIDDSTDIAWIQLGDRSTRVPASWCAAVGPALAASPGIMPPERTDGATNAPTTTDELVVVTWNVHVGGGDVTRLVRDLRSGALTGRPVHEFALLLQEVYRAGPAVPSDRSGLTSRISLAAPSGERIDVAEAAKRTGLHAFYAPSMPNGAAPDGAAEDRGNAILSTLQLDDLQAIELPYEVQRRVAVTGLVSGRASDGTPWTVRLASGHLDTRSRWSRVLDSFGKGRARQARDLASALSGNAVVLGADLNSWSASFLEGALRVLYPQFPETPRIDQSTYVAVKVIPRRLDHLLMRLPEGHTVEARRIPSRYGSDHYPLLAVVRFPGRNISPAERQSASRE